MGLYCHSLRGSLSPNLLATEDHRGEMWVVRMQLPLMQIRLLTDYRGVWSGIW